MAHCETKISLVVDASCSPLYLGIATMHGWEKIVPDSGQVMDGLFRALTQLFDGRHDSLKSVEAIYYCCGPGSTLGLRLAAAFVKTILWEANGRIKLFQYNALDLATLMSESSSPYLQAPFRMGKRFVRSGKQGAIGEKKIIAEDRALTEYPDSLHLLGPRKLSIELPADKIVSYDLEKIRGIEGLSVLSEATEQPVPYSPEPTSFKKWEGGIPAKKVTSLRNN